MKRFFVLLMLSCLFLHPIASRADVTVPDWFQYDAARPYAVFDAWEHLSTRAAAVYSGSDGKVLGGILTDTQGHPLPNTALGVTWISETGISNKVRTDDNGRFLIYGPYSLTGGQFYADPGYPPTAPGWDYAGSQKEIKECSAHAVYQRSDRAFLVVTVEAANTCSPAGFRAFLSIGAADTKSGRIMPGVSHSTSSDDEKPQTITTFPVRIVSPQGRPVAHAIVSLGSEFASGNAETDADGIARLIERAPRDKPAWYRQVSRSRDTVFIDAPGYSDGPVKCKLKAGVLTTIVPGPQAQIQGRVLDPDGFPALTDIVVCYPHNGEGALVSTRVDGTFTLDGVRPGRASKVAVNVTNLPLWQPVVPVQTAPLAALMPGEVRSGVVIHEVRPAALRGVVVDDVGGLVPVGQSAQTFHTYTELSLIFEKGGADPDAVNYNGPGACLGGWTNGLTYLGTGGFWGDPGSLFGFSGLGPTPFRLRVASSRYQPYLSDPISLEPGELRFVKIVLRRNAETPKSP